MTKKNTVEELAMQDKLRAILTPGTEVKTFVRHTSRSGMSRSISAFANTKNEMVDLDWMIARAGLGFTLDNSRGGVKMGGCGMDMGFALVYNLSRSLYRDGYKCSGHDGTGREPRCRSNDHTNYRSVLEDGTANPQKNFSRGRKHKDGGYALSHSWL